MAHNVAIVGGTGALGRGLAARWVRAGVPVGIGSRRPERAQQAADLVRELVGDAAAQLRDGTNREVVADADVIVLSVPLDALEPTLEDLAELLVGRIVVSVVNPLGFDRQGPYPVVLPEGSAAERIAAACPQTAVVAALHSVSSVVLEDVDQPLEDDVPVLGDDEAAVEQVVELLALIDGCRPLAAGALRLAGPLEGLTALLISLNKRHRTHAGLRFSRM